MTWLDRRFRPILRATITGVGARVMAKPTKTEAKREGDDTAKGMTPRSERTALAGPRAISHTLDRLISRAGQQRGFKEARILLDWAAIVGPGLANHSLPERLVRGTGGGVLHLKVAPGHALEVQHLAPLIMERINGHFGYQAVERLTLRQGPVARPRRPGLPSRRPLAPGEVASLDSLVKDVAEPELREALRRLGRAVLASRPAV
jgi:hypothetical protein